MCSHERTTRADEHSDQAGQENTRRVPTEDKCRCGFPAVNRVQRGGSDARQTTGLAMPAKMGRDAMSVVDGDLKVYGIDNLSHCGRISHAESDNRQHHGWLRRYRRACGRTTQATLGLLTCHAKPAAYCG
jgi:hypothetical protein